MANWKDIAGSKEYRSLSMDEQDAVRRDFFERAIAPSVDSDNIVTVRDDFLERTKPTLWGKTKDIAGQAMDAVGLGDTAPQAIAPSPQESDSHAQRGASGSWSVDGPSPDFAGTMLKPQGMLVQPSAPLPRGRVAATPEDFDVLEQSGLAPASAGVNKRQTAQDRGERIDAIKQRTGAVDVTANAMMNQEGISGQPINPGSVRMTPANVQFQQDNPLTSAGISGAAKFAGGAWGAADAVHRSIDPANRIGQVVGFFTDTGDPDFGKVADKLNAVGDDFTTLMQTKDFNDAYAQGRGLEWMATQAIANSPSLAGSMVGIFNPAAAGAMLGTMAASAGGGQYSELVNKGYDRNVAMLSGVAHSVFEYALERVPIEIGQRMLADFRALPNAAKAQLGQRIISGLGIGAGMAGTEGLEETGTKVGQNAADIATGYAQEAVGGATRDTSRMKGKGLFDGMKNAFMGGVSGGMTHGTAMAGNVLMDVPGRGDVPQSAPMRPDQEAIGAAVSGREPAPTPVDAPPTLASLDVATGQVSHPKPQASPGWQDMAAPMPPVDQATTIRPNRQPGLLSPIATDQTAGDAVAAFISATDTANLPQGAIPASELMGAVEPQEDIANASTVDEAISAFNAATQTSSAGLLSIQSGLITESAAPAEVAEQQTVMPTPIQESAPMPAASLSDLSNLALQQAGEYGLGGNMTEGSMPPKDWAILEQLGLVEDRVSQDGTAYRAANMGPLFQERDRRHAQNMANRRPVTEKEKTDGAERRAQWYERIAAEQEGIGELGDAELALDLRKKAADIRSGKPITDKAPNVSETGPAAEVATPVAAARADVGDGSPGIQPVVEPRGPDAGRGMRPAGEPATGSGAAIPTGSSLSAQEALTPTTGTQPSQPAQKESQAQGTEGKTTYKPGDTVRVIGGTQGKVETIDTVGEDGWVYFKSGGGMPGERVEHATPEVQKGSHGHDFDAKAEELAKSPQKKEKNVGTVSAARARGIANISVPFGAQVTSRTMEKQKMNIVKLLQDDGLSFADAKAIIDDTGVRGPSSGSMQFISGERLEAAVRRNGSIKEEAVQVTPPADTKTDEVSMAPQAKAQHRDNLKADIERMGGTYARNASTKKLEALRAQLQEELALKGQMAAARIDALLGEALTDAEWTMLLDETAAHSTIGEIDAFLADDQATELEITDALEQRYREEAQGDFESIARERPRQGAATGGGESRTETAQVEPEAESKASAPEEDVAGVAPGRVSAAPQPAKKVPENLAQADYGRISGIVVSMPVKVESTGETVTVSYNAAQELGNFDKRLSDLRSVLDCLG